MSPSRPLAVVTGVLAALAAVAALAGVYATQSDWAAVVDGRQISEREYLRELEQFRANPQISPLVPGLAEGPAGRVPGDLAAGWLGSLIQAEVIATEVEERGIQVSADHRRQGEELAVQRFQGRDSFEAFEPWFRDRLVAREANFFALLEGVAGTPSEEAVREVFDADPEAFTRTCSSHILVDTREEAEEVKAELDAAGDFAELAAERSTDLGSGQQGGELGCHPSGTFVPEFEEALATLTEGEVSEPVETEFGFHVIRLDGREGSFEEAREQISQQLLQAAQQDAVQVIADRLASADIEVSPKYGSFRVGDFGPEVVPPEAPAPPSQRPARGSEPPDDFELFPPGP